MPHRFQSPVVAILDDDRASVQELHKRDARLARRGFRLGKESSW